MESCEARSRRGGPSSKSRASYLCVPGRDNSTKGEFDDGCSWTTQAEVGSAMAKGVSCAGGRRQCIAERTNRAYRLRLCNFPCTALNQIPLDVRILIIAIQSVKHNLKAWLPYRLLADRHSLVCRSAITHSK